MTEDDAFIRTLHDHHDDEMPRLVYADWLDEQGDPRGAYLRAEVEYFRHSKDVDDARLKALQEGLDPIWINMVSRAPYGIIVPGLTFSETGPRLTSDDLQRIEEHWQAPLPADYAAFLLAHNGGVSNLSYLYSIGDIIDANGDTDEGESLYYNEEIRFLSFSTIAISSLTNLTNLVELYDNDLHQENMDNYGDSNRLRPVASIKFEAGTHSEGTDGFICYRLDDPHEGSLFQERYILVRHLPSLGLYADDEDTLHHTHTFIGLLDKIE